MNPNETPLESWKEIGAYLQRNAVTARRWEREEGLPVHRHSHKSRSSVYAYPSEIDGWRATRKVVPEPRPLWKMPAFALTLALCLVMVGNGIRPQTASAQGAGPSARQIWSGPGVDPSGSPSADGRYLSFTDWTTGNLSVRDVAAGVNRLLTRNRDASEGYPEYSVLSRDGRQVAYGWFNPAAEANVSPYELRILSVGSGPQNPRILPWGGARYVHPTAWTPDAKQLLVIRTLQDRTIQLAMVSVADGSVRPLKSLGWFYPRKASLSPDGNYVAYDMPAGDNALARDIFVLSADGTTETPLAQGAADDYGPIWSPDGSRLIFFSDRTGSVSLWGVPLQDGKPAGSASVLRKGVEGIYPLGMTASGTLHYFMGGPRRNFQIVELDADLRAATAPVRLSERFVDASGRASWSPDGQYLAYFSYRNSPRGTIGSTSLVVRSLSTGQERDVPLRLVMDNPDGVPPPRWFSGGKSVLVVAADNRTTSPRTGYYRVDIDSGAAELLHYSSNTGVVALNPDLSPDGKILYYGDGGNIVRLDLETRQTTTLTGRIAQKGILSYALSPDGTRLAYLVSGDAWGALEVMPAGGGGAREVVRLAPWSGISRYHTLGWTADGQHLLFARSEVDERNTELFQIPVAGGEPKKVGITVQGRLNHPRMHPDGRRLLYWSREPGANEVWALENFLPKTTR